MGTTITLPSGKKISSLGFGMWYLGKDSGAYFKELKLIETALDIGYRVFDVAESYGDGGAEEVLGDAIAPYRKSVFLTSKVSPLDVCYEDVIESCNKTLERLKTGYLDMYLLHWAGNQSNKEEILEAFIDLKQDGKILDFGVSNFDFQDLQEWLSMDGAQDTALNQTYFNLRYRFAQKQLLPLCVERNIPLVAYAPCSDKDGISGNAVVKEITQSRNITPCQLSTAWLLSFENLGILSKSENETSLKEVYIGSKIKLTPQEILALNKAFE